ncbi:MAG: tetraacyldisaccharide 4'-kinase, partial [Candidatus Omnitrophota bacterium]
MRKYFDDLMRDKRGGFTAALVKAVLMAVSFVYLGLIKLWDAGYRAGIFKTYDPKIKVLSVGNITVGGTGKTPFVMFVAGLLKERGRKVCVVTRGYGEDERYLLSEALRPVPVFSGRDRIKSLAEAAAGGVEIAILDDGYQHRRALRHVNILLIDAANPFGNGRMFPRGILREPVSAVKRADIAVLTKADFGGADTARVSAVLRGRFGVKKIMESVYVPECFISAGTGRIFEIGWIKDRTVCLFSGIADSGYLKYMLAGLG